MLSISGYVVFSEDGIFAYGDRLKRRMEAVEESCICLAGDCQNAGEIGWVSGPAVVQTPECKSEYL
jgi:hypothetical protein